MNKLKLSLTVFASITIQFISCMQNERPTSKQLLKVYLGQEHDGCPLNLQLNSPNIDLVSAILAEQDHNKRLQLTTPFIKSDENEYTLYTHSGNVTKPLPPVKKTEQRRFTVIPHGLYKRSLLSPLVGFNRSSLESQNCQELATVLPFAKTKEGVLKITAIFATPALNEFLLLGTLPAQPIWETAGTILYLQKNCMGHMVPVAQGTTEPTDMSYPPQTAPCKLLANFNPYPLKGLLIFSQDLTPALWEPRHS